MFDFNLTRVKGRVKVVNTFELTFDSSQRYMQRRRIFDLFLMRIKCVVKNVIIFDLVFDTNQKKSKSNFSCSVSNIDKEHMNRTLISGNQSVRCCFKEHCKDGAFKRKGIFAQFMTMREK